MAAYRRDLAQWSEQEFPLSPAGIERYLAFLQRAGMKAATIARKRAALSSFCRYLAMEGQLTDNPVALVDGEPATLGLRRSLIVYIDHRFEVLRRRSEFQLAKARERAHILEGLRIALQHLLRPG